MRDFPPIHPGEILFEEFLKSMGVSADTALRLARYSGAFVEFWTGIQTHYDTVRGKMDLDDRLEKEAKVLERVAYNWFLRTH